MDIKQGEDKVVNISITSESGSIQDMTTATAILVVLSVNDQPVKNYELGSDESGAVGKCMIDADNNGNVQVLVRKAHSEKFPLGILKANVAYEIPDTLLGTKRTEFNAVIGAVKSGYTKDYVN